jgi:ABC-type Fe3+/spermidine/putrescine transport system ATPase subunit
LALTQDGSLPPTGQEVTVLIRPEAATAIREGQPANGDPVITGILVERVFQGNYYRIHVRMADDIELDFEVDADEPLPEPGSPIRLSLSREAMSLLPAP